MLTLSSWLGGSNPVSRNRRARRAQPNRPRRGPPDRPLTVEALEDRAVPAFAAPVNYAAQSFPNAAAAGDFNNDQILDLAVANTYSSSVSVLLGNGAGGTGNGTFSPAVPAAIPTGYGPLSLAVGDFDDDGNLDLATANFYDVSVMFGNGDGTFDAPVDSYVYGYPQSVAVGDFNGDGTMDVGVTSYSVYYGYWYGWYEGYANVLLSNGDGTFQSPKTSFAGYGYVAGAAAGDFTGDGIDDFATANWDYWTVTVLSGDTSGYLGYLGDFSVGQYPWAVAAGDLNGDSKADLVAANYYGNDVSVLLGTGGGGFAAAKNYAVGAGPTEVVIEDFNADGRPDLAAANLGGNTVSVILGRSGDTFGPPEHFPAGSGSYAIAAGDFLEDGFADLATANRDTNNASVLINDLSWPPPPPPSVSVSDASVTEGNSGTVNATFVVSLSYAAEVDVTVHYDTADGTAKVSDGDYVALSGDVTIPAGSTSKQVTVVVNGDTIVEPNETFALNLSSPTNATLGDSQGIGTIIDDEPRVWISDVSLSEGNSGQKVFNFTVTLSPAGGGPVTVDWATAAGTATAGVDYLTDSGTLTFAAGDTSETISVAVLGDEFYESNETFTVNLSNPVGALITDGTGVGTIVNDDSNLPRISITDVAKAEGRNGVTQFTFTVTLSEPASNKVKVSYATANGTATAGEDYTDADGTITFQQGQTSKTVTIKVKGDQVVEADETFFVNLFGAVNGVIVDDQGVGTIQNDD